MYLKEKSENSSSIIQFLFYVVCHIPASIHVNLKVPILSAGGFIPFGQDSSRAKGEDHREKRGWKIRKASHLARRV